MAFDFSSMEAHTCRAGPALRGATVNPGDHAIDASNDIMEEVDKLATQTTLTQRQIWMAIVDKLYMNDGAPVRGVSEKTVKNRVQEAWGHDSSHGRASIMTNPRLTKIKGSHQGFFQFQYAWHDDVKALKKPPKDANGIDQITAVCEVKGLEYSRSKWRTFWSYFQRTWLETYPPEYWNVFGMRRDIISRTNNPLERFHRELNKRFNAHPPMKTFVTSLENLAREYVAQRTTVISGLAKPPERTGFVLPRQPKLPEVSDIVDSPASSDGEGEIVDADADSEPYSSAMSSTGDENVEPGEYIQPDHTTARRREPPTPTSRTRPRSMKRADAANRRVMEATGSTAASTCDAIALVLALVSPGSHGAGPSRQLCRQEPRAAMLTTGATRGVRRRKFRWRPREDAGAGARRLRVSRHQMRWQAKADAGRTEGLIHSAIAYHLVQDRASF
ncbi:hypothetical protein PHYSODRAFT_324361 [Phytophthora sojae]|uniref:Uncharacterized protein n=1 Tax=Phytophthora sojae (strain P6497) TaxID=1094619 RepID=G4YU29_PHYSP|nr:hypothetical protein PHYSODRAFT_324361 [Phytophthora sojae]EGZ23107.1 hypothetical protein PHYSODRAFT_324361 [Phytophthora sojae]|eukprot:XP_009518395.1 hypothetical protein PHYSODRAFT_324361 [Phytophthora sojae]